MSPVRRPPRSEGDRRRAAKGTISRCFLETEGGKERKRTLLINQRHETGTNPHSRLEDPSEVAMEEEGLGDGAGEHGEGEEVCFR